MRELLFSVTKKDFDITWFSGRGAGGQHRNKHQNCCRIIHRESGAMGTGQSERSRVANQKQAFDTLVRSDKFQAWLRAKTNLMLVHKQVIEDIVGTQMQNVRVEYRKNGKWVESSDD